MSSDERFGDLTDEQLNSLRLICNRFEQALREDTGSTIESLLEESPVELQRPLFLRLLDIELAWRFKSKPEPIAGEFHARFPDRTAEVEFAFDRARDPGTDPGNEETNFHDSSQKTDAQPASDFLGLSRGNKIGPYQLIQPIGEGGMGSVWMAVQKEPVRRTVALKIIKAGMDTREVIARFEAERQALALMNHPNIAKVLDAGATEAGRPYFVMELVDGIPITEYCDDQHLKAEQRLRLFTSVCRGVQHAHQKGIIHRDIKPTNILVALHDGEPVVKVIDFGLAKATGQSLTEKTMFTALGQMVGTPAYMSPEQADAGGLDIDTRTDVYSLGVLLYELLTGVTPIDIKQLRSAGYAEIQRMIREDSPPAMSNRLSSLGQDSQVIASNRATDSKRLTQTLRGDLDLIVMKALEKDRGRRYETPSSFAADIDRFLANEEIEARPASAGYRLKKLIRRNKTAVITTSAVALALLVGTIVSTWQAMVASEQRDLAVEAGKAETKQRLAADEQRDRAVTAEAETEQRADELQLVTDFQARMLEQIDTTRAGKFLSDDVTAKFAAARTKAGVPDDELAQQVDAFRSQWIQVNATDAARDLIDQTLLKPAIGAIDEQFNDQPVVDARLRNTLAKLYRDIGLYEAALPLQTAALEKRRRELGDEHPDTLYSLTNMGVLLQSMGKLEEAEPYHVASLEKRRRVLGEEHPDTLISLNNMGFLLQSQSRLDEAKPFYVEALEKRRRVLGEDHEFTIASISNMGFLLQAQGKRAEAEPYWREALASSRRVLGDEHPSTLTAINNLGYLMRIQNKMDEAEPLHREALEKRRRVLGEEHPETLSSLNNLGILMVTQGKLVEAEPYFQELLVLRRKVLGEDHPSTLTSLANLGVVLQRMGKLAESEVFAREALAKKRRLLGDEHSSTLVSVSGLGVLLLKQGKLDDAEPLLREALEKQRKVDGEDHPRTINSIGNLGLLLLEQEKLDAAKTLLQESIEKGSRVLGAEHPTTLNSIIVLGSLLNAQADHDAALSLLQPIEDSSRKTFTAANAYRLGQLLMHLGQARAGRANNGADFENAEVNLREAHGIHEKTPGPDTAPMLDCTNALVDLYSAWHLIEPDKGYDAKAEEWTAQLESQQQRLNDD